MTARRAICCLSITLALALVGCSTWKRPAVAHLPVANSTLLDQLVVYSESPLPQRHRLLEELNSQRGVLAGKLGLPASDERIHVYLFPTAEALQDYMRVHHPDFPDRRACFVESDTRLMVYAYWGDRVAEDLRHEVAHGYLHSVVPNLPLWLDEGLAEYFEVPRGNRGLNVRHVEELTAALGKGWQPNLPRLEQMRNAADMHQLDYAEAWAWVHLMLETTPERSQLLRDYLQNLRHPESLPPLSQRLRSLHPDYERLLVDYVVSLGQALR